MKLILLIGMLIDSIWREPNDGEVEVEDKRANDIINDGHAIPADPAVRDMIFKLNPRAEKKCRETTERLAREAGQIPIVVDDPPPTGDTPPTQTTRQTGGKKGNQGNQNQQTATTGTAQAQAVDELAPLAIEDELKLLLRSKGLITKDAIRTANLTEIPGINPVYAQRILDAVGAAG